MNNNFESQQMRRQQQHYSSYNKNNHIQPYVYHQNPATCNFNINPLTYISNNIQSPHALNVHPNTLNTNINPHKTYTYNQSAPYQSFPALPTYPANVIPSYIYPQHTNLAPPLLPPTPKAHVNNTSVSNALSSIPEHQNEDEKDVIDVDKNEEPDTELNEEDIKVNNINNPWFNEEIASIVKLHRKTARKYHRSKTKPKELKQLCKKLEKKKRKLIRDAKEKYMRELMAKKGDETASKMTSNLEVDANENENENDERKSGYFALDVIQPICSIIWNRYWDYWSSGNHWKIDVDDILDLGVDEQMNLDLRELMNMIQDSAKKQWQYYNNSYTGKFSMYLMDVEDVLDIG